MRRLRCPECNERHRNIAVVWEDEDGLARPDLDVWHGVYQCRRCGHRWERYDPTTGALEES